MLTVPLQLLHKSCKPLSAKPDSPAAKMTPKKSKGCHCDAKLPSVSGMRSPSFFGSQRNVWDAPHLCEMEPLMLPDGAVWP